MTSLSILDSDAQPQSASPLFTRLPSELRLMIYNFVFVGCRANVWLDDVMKVGEYIETSEGRRRRRDSKWAQCCYEHFEGGFGLLATCRIVHIEALPIYWSETVLTVQGWCCNLEKICYYQYLPVTIKENLRHLRNIEIPMEGEKLVPRYEPKRTPQLLKQFPKLVSCEFSIMHGVQSDKWLLTRWTTPHELSLPDSGDPAQFYHGVGPFTLKNGESAAAYLERTMGLKPSCGVMILFKTIYAFGTRYERPKCCKWRVSPIPTCVSYLKQA